MTAIFYEVYSKRAIQEPISSLVTLDRFTARKKAIPSARLWGGVVVKVEAEVVQRHPLIRKAIATKIVFIHRPIWRRQSRDDITHKILMGRIRNNSVSLYKRFKR